MTVVFILALLYNPLGIILPSKPYWNPEFTGQVHNIVSNGYVLTRDNPDGSTTGLLLQTHGCSFQLHQTVRIQTSSDGQQIRFSPNQIVPAGCSII